jgi:hypothetical protein
MRALEVFGFKHSLSGPSDHPVDAPDGTSESMLSSGISRNIFIWVLVRDVTPSTYLVSTIFPEYVLGTYWYVLCLQKYCSGCCFMLYACGKQYYVCMTCMLWCSNTELCPYWCPIYMTLFRYILSTYSVQG